LHSEGVESKSSGVEVVLEMPSRSDDRTPLPKQSAPKTEKPTKKRRRPYAWAKRTPLQKAIHKLGLTIGVLAVIICVITFVSGLLRGYRDPAHPDQAAWLSMLMVAVSLAVSAVPEGLPLIVTITLALGTQRMARKKALIRKLSAVETLGSAQVICTDKTGTLTEGKMSALNLFAGMDEYEITGEGFAPVGSVRREDGTDITKLATPDLAPYTAMLSVALNAATILQKDAETGDWQALGSSTEAPLVVCAAKFGLWTEPSRSKYPMVDEIPFNSARKMNVTVHKITDNTFGSLPTPAGTNFAACVKGAPNYLLSRCSAVLGNDGLAYPMTSETHSALMEQVDHYSSLTLRVLAIGVAFISTSNGELPYLLSGEVDAGDKIDTLLGKPGHGKVLLLGLVASADPPRKGVDVAIETARQAGVKTVMITGDYLQTAIAIARNVGLLPVGSDIQIRAVDCSILRPSGEYLPNFELDEITSRTTVYARALPRDKLEIVKSLQRQRMVVGMTGDGVNDSPALKQADIGIAMGKTGTAVAKGAADLILTEDDFPTIINAIEEGRSIYGNIQKFVMWMVATNLSQLILILTSIVVGLPTPLQPLQILFVNLTTDGIPAISLSMDPSEPSSMQQPPRKLKEPILHGRRLRAALIHSFSLVCAMMCAFLITLYMHTGKFLTNDISPDGATDGDIQCSVWQPGSNKWIHKTGLTDCSEHGIDSARTAAFVVLVISENLRLYTVRNLLSPFYHRLFTNKWLPITGMISIGLGLFVALVPGVRQVFSMTSVGWHVWLLALGLSLVTVVIDEYFKFRMRDNDESRRRWRLVEGSFEELLQTVRALRAHVVSIESAQHKTMEKIVGPIDTPQTRSQISKQTLQLGARLDSGDAARMLI